MTKSPVLFLVFNRPETTQRVFEAIRAARPPRLYVAADGPRESRADEAQRCARVREIAVAVDWPCEVKTLFREQNLGCKRAVSSAIDWFFAQEAEGIILEDDCLPHPTFFPYCDELLERYRQVPSVMMISGDNFISSVWEPQEGYYFSRYTHIWGWASWRRAWKHYDVLLSDWGRGSASHPILRTLFPKSASSRKHWARIFNAVAAGAIDTWDYQWNYACWKQGGLVCIPRRNLISNIGFGAGATHTTSPESKMANLPFEALTFPLQHPSAIEPSSDADRWTSKHVFEIKSDFVRIVRGLARRLSRLRLRLTASAS
jgi:hypothetical protein